MLGFECFSNARRVLAGVESRPKERQGQFQVPEKDGCSLFECHINLSELGKIASLAFHLEKSGVKVVGEVSSGLPRLGLSDVWWGDLPLVLSVSVCCFIVILAQSAATSRAYALRYRERFDENLDLVGLALANAAAACSGTFVVNGSPTKTAMVDHAGGRSQLSHLATAAVVLLVLLFLTWPLSHLPNAVLAAIVFLIGVKLIDYRGLAEIPRVRLPLLGDRPRYQWSSY